jgi:hypothetical protein
VTEAGDLVIQAEILVGAARDAYQAAVDAPSPATHAFDEARDAAQRALDADWPQAAGTYRRKPSVWWQRANRAWAGSPTRGPVRVMRSRCVSPPVPATRR